MPVLSRRWHYCARLKKLDAIDHLLGGEDLSNQHRASDEKPDSCIGRREQNARVRHSSRVQSQMIWIGGNQHPALLIGKREEHRVRSPKLSRIASGRDVYPTRNANRARPRSVCVRQGES